VAGEHVHPAASETFTVVRGRLGVRHGGRELQAGPGTRVEVPPGAHEFWNAADEEVRLVVEVRPGERLEQLIRQLFLAAQDGRTDARGGPGRCTPPCWPAGSPTPSGSPARPGSSSGRCPAC
jgi:hypothetical protein